MALDTVARPRNAEMTRQAIRDAAARRFSAHAYEQVGLRDIAGDVGVDPALISRYFGSKEDLFLAVMEACGDGAALMEGEPSDFGRRMARELVYGVRREGKLDWLMVVLRSAGSPKAAEVLRRTSAAFHDPFVAWIAGENARVRARIITSLIMGLVVGRDISGGYDFSDEERRDMCDRLAPLLQGLVDGDLGSKTFEA